MPTETILRLATLQDLPRVVDIYNATVPTRISTADTEPVTVESRIPWFHAHDARRPLYVFEDDGLIQAWVSFQDFYGRPAYHRTAELSIYVDQAYRGKGVGSRLVKACIELCPSLGIDNLLGFVFSHNSASLALLKKQGFQTWGELPAIAEMDGQLYGLTILGLKLTTAS